MFQLDPASYGSVFGSLLSTDRCRALDEGAPDAGMSASLAAVELAAAFAPAAIVDRDHAQCCLSGLWLLYDLLDESHAISQGVSTSSGSYWHGVMHRREGDFSNAKYWFRRAGEHPIEDDLAAAAAALADSAEAEAIAARLAGGGRWDACAMVDACQAALRSGGAAGDYCRRVQQAEWDLLWDHCFRRAAGS